MSWWLPFLVASFPTGRVHTFPSLAVTMGVSKSRSCKNGAVSGSINCRYTAVSGSRNCENGPKNIWIQKLQKWCDLWIQKLQNNCRFRIQNLRKWITRFLDPEIIEMVRFLDPEIIEMVDRSYIKFLRTQFFLDQMIFFDPKLI